MAKYELTVVLEPGLKKEAKDKLVKKIKSWVKAGNAGGQGKVLSEKEWGMRDLSYPINKYSEALYYLFDLEAEGNLEEALQEKAALESRVLRYLLVRV
jgi:small subunit ribosomal protein S6